MYWPDAPLLGPCEWPARSDASLELGDVFSGNLGMQDPLASGKSAGGGGGGAVDSVSRLALANLRLVVTASPSLRSRPSLLGVQLGESGGALGALGGLAVLARNGPPGSDTKRKLCPACELSPTNAAVLLSPSLA